MAKNQIGTAISHLQYVVSFLRRSSEWRRIGLRAVFFTVENRSRLEGKD
jgi:hypothetical protein